MNKKILYISYDGMTDPLGQSQVLPYLVGLTKSGYQFTILSFEKVDKYDKFKSTIEAITQQAGIRWVPMRFTNKPPLLSKFYDAVRMRRKAFSLFRKYKFDMIHCRSYIAANLGLQLKRKKGAKFFLICGASGPMKKRMEAPGTKTVFCFDEYTGTIRRKRHNS